MKTLNSAIHKPELPIYPDVLDIQLATMEGINFICYSYLRVWDGKKHYLMRIEEGGELGEENRVRDRLHKHAYLFRVIGIVDTALRYQDGEPVYVPDENCEPEQARLERRFGIPGKK